MARKRIGAGGPFLVSPKGDNLSGQTSTFVSNASAPQIVNYALIAGLGFFCASAITPQGQANASEYQFGTHAQAIHQAEALKSRIFPSVRTPPAAATPAPIRQIYGAPELIDLSISGWVISGAEALQGPVPPTIFAGQSAPASIQSQVWKAALAPVVVAGRIGMFLSTSTQFEDRPTQTVWPSQSTGSRPPVIKLLWAAPQGNLSQQGAIFPLASTAPAAASYVFQYIYGAPQVIDLTQQGWIRGPASAPQGRVPAMLWASQEDPTLLAPPATIFPGVILVPVPASPNLHKLYIDLSSGRLFWRVSGTANPIEILPL